MKKFNIFSLKVEEEKELKNKNINYLNSIIKNKKNKNQNIDDWSKFEPKNNNLIKYKNNIVKKPLNMIINKSHVYLLIFKNLIKLEKLKLNINENFKRIFDFYYKIEIFKLNPLKTKKNKKINNFLIIDIKKLKSKIILMKKNKCIETINNGYVFKKLNLLNKKYKKSEKLLFIGLKTLFYRNLNLFKERVIINIKGLNVNKFYTKLFLYIINNLNKKNLVNKIVFINTLSINKKNIDNFKKIKAIKRKLKKKNLKNN